MTTKKFVKKIKKVQPHITAWLDDGNGGRIMVTVPVQMDSIPEAPTVVLFERRAYVMTCPAPLIYTNVIGGRAKRIK